MFRKLVAARQLGASGLINRAIWRAKMFPRIALFHLHWKRSRKRIVDGDSTELHPTYSFLPSQQTISSLLVSDALCQPARRRIARNARMVISDEFEFRGIGKIRLNLTTNDWYKQTVGNDPASSAEAVMINRHDFLLPLVQSVLIDKSSKSRAKIHEMFDYWIENFNVSALLRFDTPIDAAIRLVNWLWVLSFDLLDIPKQKRARLLDIIRIQVEYISAWRSLGGNHLVLEALSNYLIFLAFPSLPGASRGLSWSKRALVHELSRQTTEDGIHTEQSVFYHQAVATHFLKFVLGARAANDPLPKRALDQFGRMLDYVHDTMKPDLTHPVLGDGELLATDDREHWESKVLLAARTHLFSRPMYREFRPSVNDTAIWFLGLDPRNIETTRNRPSSRVFAMTGAAVFRDENRYVYFDAAPFGDPELPHHGHADALSVEFFANGANIFVDPGGYGYYDDDYRRFFRSTAAHNTVIIDGKSQSALFGVFGYGKLAIAALQRHKLGDDLDFVSGSHDGYAPVQHTRELYFRKGQMQYLLIIDYFLGPANHSGTALFHLPPEAHVDSEFCIISENADSSMATTVVSSVPFAQRVVRGLTSPTYQGWVSPRTSVVVPADTWEIDFNFTGCAFVASVIAAKETMPIVTYAKQSGELKISGARQDEYFLELSRNPITKFRLNS